MAATGVSRPTQARWKPGRGVSAAPLTSLRSIPILSGQTPTRLLWEGHSCDGKATLVTAALDDRIVAALPSCGGAGGTSFLRRNYGESIESIVGNGEYYWVAGGLMNYAGAAC